MLDNKGIDEMWNDEKIKVFVKDTLGCTCPEKVFEKIGVTKHKNETHAEVITRIVIGDTLLIYIMRPDSAEDLVDSVETIGSGGKIDRDIHGYNRFRLVVADDERNVQWNKVSECFSKAFVDEKMHIHFVHEELIAGLH